MGLPVLSNRSFLAQKLSNRPLKQAFGFGHYEGVGGLITALAKSRSGAKVARCTVPVARHGYKSLRLELLREKTASGLPFENAFVRATGTTLAVAEQTFWERQTFWYRWVPFLTSSMVLWILITLLALWAMRRRRQRDAAQKAAWEAEEIARALREENLPGPM